MASNLRVGDWHADGRMCYMARHDLAARDMTRTLRWNQWRTRSEFARTTGISTRHMVLNPADLQHTIDETAASGHATPEAMINKEDKAVQCGPHVAQAYLEALFSEARVTSSDYAPMSWIQLGEKTWFVDRTPWAGYGRLATFNLI